MSEAQQYRVIRPFNNNVLLVERMEDGHETVLIGKGLGFSAKANSIVEAGDPRVEKTFLLKDENYRNQYRSLLEQVEDATVGVSEEIIGLIAKHLSPRYNEHIHIALADHISFAIYRLKSGMEIVNPFLYEIETLYPNEFALSKKSAELIEKRLSVKIPASEIGFLTLHIHSAISQTPVTQAARYADLIRQIVELARQRLDLQLPQGSRDCVRFIAHLRYALERITNGKTVENPLLERIQQECVPAYQFAEEIVRMIENNLSLSVPSGEIGYIAMHVHRLSHAREVLK